MILSNMYHETTHMFIVHAMGNVQSFVQCTMAAVSGRTPNSFRFLIFQFVSPYAIFTTYISLRLDERRKVLLHWMHYSAYSIVISVTFRHDAMPRSARSLPPHYPASLWPPLHSLSCSNGSKIEALYCCNFIQQIPSFYSSIVKYGTCPQNEYSLVGRFLVARFSYRVTRISFLADRPLNNVCILFSSLAKTGFIMNIFFLKWQCHFFYKFNLMTSRI